MESASLHVQQDNSNILGCAERREPQEKKWHNGERASIPRARKKAVERCQVAFERSSSDRLARNGGDPSRLSVDSVVSCPAWLDVSNEQQERERVRRFSAPGEIRCRQRLKKFNVEEFRSQPGREGNRSPQGPAGNRSPLACSESPRTRGSQRSSRSGSYGACTPARPKPAVLNAYRSAVEQVMGLRRVSKYSMDCGADSEDFQLFRKALSQNCLCATLVDLEVRRLAQHAELFAFQPGDKVLLGKDVNSFFVIKEGLCSLHIYSRDEDMMCGTPYATLRLEAGQCFGELAIVHGSHWYFVLEVDGVSAGDSCSDAAQAGANCWVIDRGNMYNVLMTQSERVYRENLKVLDNVRMFQYLDAEACRNVCRTLTVQHYNTGASVYEEYRGACQAAGIPLSPAILIVKSGRFEVKVHGLGRVGMLKPGDLFGERAWLYKEPRDASVLALEPSAVIVVKVGSMMQVLGKSTFVDICRRSAADEALRRCFIDEELAFLAQSLAESSINRLSDVCMIRTVPPSSDVDSAHGLRFFVVLNGSVVVRAPGDNEGRCCRRGDWFGKEYLLDLSRPFKHTVVNESDSACELAVFFADAVNGVLHKQDPRCTEFSDVEKMRMVRRVHVFRHISEHHCALIAKSLKTTTMSHNEVVVREGETGSQFFVIQSGELVVTIKDRKLRTLGKGDYFGERGLLYDEPRTASVSISSDVADLLVIDKSVFSMIVEGKMLAYLEERIRLQQTDVSLDDLTTVKTIGKGNFGIVKLVSHKSNGTRYALKCIRRAQAVAQNQQASLRKEREIMLENDHPFIVHVVKTFKDKTSIYFLQELVDGQEMFEMMRAVGIFSREQAQFYIGGLILALESLHDRCIAYRDLKPENILLDSHGFTKVIDFGCATKLRGLAYTVVGTPHYIAPEILLGNGYGLSCDVWALGILLYELVCGPLPFGADEESPDKVFVAVLRSKLQFPARLQDKDSEKFLKRLLTKSVGKRIGCSPSCWTPIRKHRFFRDFSFDKLLSRDVQVPIFAGPRSSETSTGDREPTLGSGTVNAGLEPRQSRHDTSDDGTSSSGLSLSDGEETDASKAADAEDEDDWAADF